MEEELRKWREKCGAGEGRQKRFTLAQQAEALELVKRARAARFGKRRTAEALGVTETTIRRWRRSASNFAPVKVKPAAAAPTGVIVGTVKGLRVELTVAQLLELMERLS